MLPSANAASTASQPTRNVPAARAQEALDPEEPIVFRVIHLAGGGWRLEKSGGDVGGFFISKHAALSYACGQAEWCRSSSVRIELRDPQAPASND
jgi:hypothetical protein